MFTKTVLVKEEFIVTNSIQRVRKLLFLDTKEEKCNDLNVIVFLKLLIVLI